MSGPTVSTKTSKIGQGQPRVIIYINFVELESLMLHVKFQDHRTSGSGEEDFKDFCHILGMAEKKGIYEPHCLAHLSQRLTIGERELIGYPWSVVRPSSTISNVFSSKTTWPIKAKFYV